MDYFTELFEPGNSERKKGAYLVVKTGKPFAEFRDEVYGTYLVLHNCEIIDIDGNIVALDENAPPLEHLGWNSQLVCWTVGRTLNSEEMQAIFKEVAENNMGRIRRSKTFFNL